MNIWQSCKQERDCLVHFLRLLAVCWPSAQSARDSHVLACNFCHIFTNFNFFSLADSSINLFLIRLLTTPPHLKYVVTLSCNLSLMACFVDINVSQSSVVIYARCGGIVDIHLTANLPRNLLVNLLKSVKN